jgi:methylated-DNA-protein-cysteine methyltransferase related protein
MEGVRVMQWQPGELPDVLKQRVYEAVQQVPVGQVATYGDIATVVGGGVDARTVGFALNEIPKHGTEEIPWQRIINAQGGISTKGLLQRKLLEDEGIVFEENNRIDLRRFRWPGPSAEWAADNGYNVLPPRDDAPADQLTLF